MGKNCRSYEQHDFYCIACGNKGMPLLRGTNKSKEKLHRKYMWCPYCREMMNHIECRNEKEIAKFKRMFANNNFAQEVKEEREYAKEHPRLQDYV